MLDIFLQYGWEPVPIHRMLIGFDAIILETDLDTLPAIIIDISIGAINRQISLIKKKYIYTTKYLDVCPSVCASVS